MKKILVPIDGSQNSIRGLDKAIELANQRVIHNSASCGNSSSSACTWPSFRQGKKIVGKKGSWIHQRCRRQM